MLCLLTYRFPPHELFLQVYYKRSVLRSSRQTGVGGGMVMSSAQWSWKVTPSLRGGDTQQGSVKKLTQMSQSLLQSTAPTFSHTQMQWYTTGSLAQRWQTWQQQKTDHFYMSKCYDHQKILLHMHSMTSSSVIIIGQKQHHEKRHNKPHLCQLLLDQLLYALTQLLTLSAYIMGINLHLDLSEKNHCRCWPAEYLNLILSYCERKQQNTTWVPY